MTKDLQQSSKEALLPATVSPQMHEAMMGDMGQDDVNIPRLVVLEGLSPEVTKEKLGFPGDLFVKVLNKNYKDGPVEVIPLFRYKSRIRFKPKNEGGGILCRSKDGKVGVGEPGGNCLTCGKKEWHGVEQPECSEFHNVICLIRGEEDKFPVAVSGSKTRLKAFKNWNSLFLMNTQPNKDFPQGRPLFAKSYLIKPKAVQNAAQQESHTFDFSVGNNNAPLPAAEQEMAFEWFNRLIGKVQVMEDEPPAAEAETKEF